MSGERTNETTQPAVLTRCRAPTVAICLLMGAAGAAVDFLAGAWVWSHL